MAAFLESVAAVKPVGDVGVSVMNPITAYDLVHRGMVSKPFVPAINYSFGMVYQEKWRNNKLVELIRDNLPSLSDYLGN